MTCWKSLLLIYSRIDVPLSTGRLPAGRFAHQLPSREIDDAIESFRCFPSLVANLTDREASIEYEIRHSERTLPHLTEWGEGYRWPSPHDTLPELRKYAPPGTFDSIFVLWPQNNLQGGSSIKSGGWGLGLAASPASMHATYATVANVEAWMWKIPMAGEVWLHEWLHGVCAFFSGQGFKMPDGDADGGDRHGYTRSQETGWTGYYRDLMTGRVSEEGRATGIPLSAWRIPPSGRKK